MFPLEDCSLLLETDRLGSFTFFSKSADEICQSSLN